MFVIKGTTYQEKDGRTAIEMTEGNKEFVLAEMRGFLESVQKINQGILENDANLISEAGKKSGGSVIAHAPKGLMKTLPSGFKELGFSTHDLFDILANTTPTNFDKTTTQNQLNQLLNNCVACHKTYKISVNKNE